MQHDTALQIRMGHLLKKMFRGLDIARPCLFFNQTENLPPNLDDHEYVIITENGAPKGFVKIGGNELQDFDDEFCLDQAMSLHKVIIKLQNHEVIFFKALGQVISYVTLSDLQKAPVRMWLFGMVTVVEMFITQILKEKYDEDLLKTAISEGRFQKTQELQTERKRRGQNVDLIDCLQLRDKIEILAKDQELRDKYEFSSKTQLRKAGKSLEELRNNLAHAQTLTNLDLIWAFAEKIDNVLKRI